MYGLVVAMALTAPPVDYEAQAAFAFAKAKRERTVTTHVKDHAKTGETEDCCKLTYAEASAKALKENKPLVVWVGGGDTNCPACIHTLEKEAVHHVTLTFPDTPPKALVVAVPENGQLLRVATITEWTTGDATFGHVPSIRRALAHWRERRGVTTSGWSFGGMTVVGYQQQTMMYQAPMMRMYQPQMRMRRGGG